ncbi:hypothetical protein Taro_021033, partial [Colocasia esculenta]|nr:hypothetical protein [Colocasia esculenta]
LTFLALLNGCFIFGLLDKGDPFACWFFFGSEPPRVSSEWGGHDHCHPWMAESPESARERPSLSRVGASRPDWAGELGGIRGVRLVGPDPPGDMKIIHNHPNNNKKEAKGKHNSNMGDMKANKGKQGMIGDMGLHIHHFLVPQNCHIQISALVVGLIIWAIFKLLDMVVSSLRDTQEKVQVNKQQHREASKEDSKTLQILCLALNIHNMEDMRRAYDLAYHFGLLAKKAMELGLNLEYHWKAVPVREVANSGWRHEEQLESSSINWEVSVLEMEACDLIFIHSFTPLTRWSSLTAVLSLRRSSSSTLDISVDRITSTAEFIYPGHVCGDTGWLSQVPIGGVTMLSLACRRLRCAIFRRLRLAVWGFRGNLYLLLGLAHPSLLYLASLLLGDPHLPHFPRLVRRRARRLLRLGSFSGIPLALSHPLEGNELVGGGYSGDAYVPRHDRLTSIKPDAYVSDENGFIGVGDDRLGLITLAALALPPFSKDCDAGDGVH